MKNFKIVKDNKPSLRERSTPIELPPSEDLVQTLNDMLDYLKSSNDDKYLKKHPRVRAGVGLAAPQIGINKQMIAIYYKDADEKVHEYMLINPKIVSESVKRCCIEAGEGCLSVEKEHPGYVYRAYKVTVECYDIKQGKNMTYTFTGYLSIVIQHEIDHLKGILFYDHIDKKDPFRIIDAVRI